ncbi:beta-alanine-activating enzyme [Maniola hyperantus]|uniref:beta-alanine-activating enzyme n=1 Tax=Aphantopus hyperantus TaxID=2795564 RepID=UPI00156869C8|nr:beta-alanine-activating enzyme isoform X1 [Maniola hyperantus]
MKLRHGYYDMFVRTCAKYPSRIAMRHYVNDAYKNYTYSELYGVCEYISQNLQQLVCGKGIIALVSERNIIIPCVIAAAHKCSTSFMFLDPSQDVQAIASQVNCKILITIKEFEKEASSKLNGKKPDKSVTVFNMIVNFYALQQSGSQHSYKHVPDHSYIAMTSGSTGEPKHVQVPVHCLQPNIDDLTKMFEISPQDVIYFSTPLTFDPSMIEILLACMNGASLLIAPEKTDILFPENKENAVTFWQTTPSKFFQYSNADIKNKILSANSTLKTLALGGEPLNGVKRLKELKDAMNKTRIFTLYGVTEMSCWACVAELDLNNKLNDREIPLGECLSETQIVLEPTNHQEKDTGKIILVSKTRKCVILNKSMGTEEENSLKFIDTGDIGEVKNGTIYYRGRKDDIIKRFGHKVNLQAIEATVMQCPRVKTCSCVWLPKPMLLVVYFSSETLSSQELLNFLKCKLNEKFWPDKTIKVDNLPTNPHGKISKQMLSQLFEKSSQMPKTLDSLRLMFLKELKVSLGLNVTYEDIKHKDFFAVGGTSFLAVLMCNKLSLMYPQFGHFILPFLVIRKKTIDEIIQLAYQELNLEVKTSKKRLKRSRSNTESFISTAQSTKKLVKNPEHQTPVEYVVLWLYDTGKCVDASPTLYQHGFTLYVTVGSHSGQIVIIDAISGQTKGVIKVNSRVEAAVCCSSEAPLSTPCGMVGTYDGTIVCFTLETGIELWRINVGSMIKSKGVCCKGLLYIASYDGNIRCIEVLTGEIKHTIKVAEQAISADLALAKQEYILLGTLSGVCASVHSDTKTVAWRGVLGSPVFASPALYDNDKYVVFAEVSGEIHCRTVEKGIKIWKYQGAKGNIFSSIYIKEIDKLKWQMVFGCHDNKVYSIMVKNFQPMLHWKAKLTSPIYSTPRSLSDKLILAVSNNGILCILDSDTGTVISEYTLPNETFSTPAVYGDYIFIGCRNDHLYSLKYILNI